ncbi:hypothetical protein GLX27_002516 [Malassezia furfur]|uniref:MPN domain-containing protein n=1 Tax=Malassezia furfur TaxID=55194 RepID=A0ABY8EU96_MALFU|nr:hypothetical protein CBS14141_000424 [Malassezia furfur]WFD47853.1 hypothetical protein GLX27_002516 [Malassezia furfur]
MAPEVKHVELSERAYRKLVLHGAKYPSETVVGVLVGKHGSTVDVNDVIPLTHHWTQLSPMTEAGLAMIDAHLKGNEYKMVGVYEVPESLDVTEPENTTKLLARKLAAKSSQPSVVLLADGKELLAPKLKALTAFVESADGKGPKTPSKPTSSVQGYNKLVPALDEEVNDGRWKALSDWDDHLEDTRRDWLTNADVV